MSRISIVGNSGGGKSTLARRLGEALSLPVVHLDVLFWKPGWVASDDATFRTDVAQALNGPSWVCDGNFPGTYDLRMPMSDVIVWIDQPPLLCLWRAVSRVVAYRGGSRPDMAEGCHEAFDLNFYRFILTFNAKVRPRLKAALTQHAGDAKIVRLRSDREIAAFVAAIRPTA